MISVVIPAHNAERYLQRAVSSVRAQTLAAAELVVVNDGSTDGTAAVIADAGGNRVLETSFGHGGLARNAGVEEASGRWIAFLDADDFWEPDHLERSLGLLEAAPGQVGTINHFVAESVDGQRQERGTLPPPFAEPAWGLSDGDYLDHYAAAGWFPGMTAAVVDRQRFLEVGGFSADMPRRHDLEMWLRLVRGRTWAWDSKPTSVYQKNTPGSISSARAEPEMYAFRAWEKQLDRWDDPRIGEQLRAAARRAASAAITDGSRTQQRAMLPELIPHLAGSERALARLALVAPGPLAAANRLRRRWVMRHHERLGERHAEAEAPTA